MRVTQRNMFFQFVDRMNTSLSKLMDYNVQASSQKRINKPSDDNIGAARVLTIRSRIGALNQHIDNVKNAKGWLSTADGALTQVNTVLTRLKELAEQGATGTYSGQNRTQIAFEARQLHEQLITLANTEYEGKHIFAGHKTNISPYEAGLQVVSTPPHVSGASFLDTGRYVESVIGQTDHAVSFKFIDDSGASTEIGANASASLAVRWSSDGGTTWKERTIGQADEFTMDGVTVRLRQGTPIALSTRQVINQGGKTFEDTSGTLLHVVPTAVYKGDDENKNAVDFTGSGTDYNIQPSGSFERDYLVSNVSVRTIGGRDYFYYSYSIAGTGAWVSSSNLIADPTRPAIRLPDGDVAITELSGLATFSAWPTATADLAFTIRSKSSAVDQMVSGSRLNAWADGSFAQNVMVRIDSQISGPASYDITTDPINYSFSTDGGSSWTTGQTGNNGVFTIPGGTMTLSALGAPPNTTVNPGDKFVVHPRKGDIMTEISPGSTIAVNSIGKNIFGGVYNGTIADAFNGDDPAKNVFDVVGKLVGYLETNTQSGVQQALEGLRTASENVLVRAAEIGGRENRLEITEKVLSQDSLTKRDLLSGIEDVDVTELMTKLAQQQLAYQAVLKSSSTIMQMSLLNYM